MKTKLLLLLSIVFFLFNSCKDSADSEPTKPTEPEITENYHYDLPVIFHVFYKNQNDPLQYVSPNRLSEILNVVNGMYKNTTQSVNMNLTFTLATTDPKGAQLVKPGVEYIEWLGEYPIDCEKFMSDDLTAGGKGYVKYLWDPNKYINIMIYNFTKEAENGATTLGISHLPFTTKGEYSLEGLSEIKQSYIQLSNLTFPYCTSINSSYIDSQSNEEFYTTTDITVTLAHELGHYLGLHHTFSEDTNGGFLNGCEDTDYCEDTPSYNKIEYDDKWNDKVPENQKFYYLLKRTNCSNKEFISHNIMDYAISYSDQFTQDQRNRVRHVLMYSPLIPGPKKTETTTTRTVDEGLLNLPILIRK